MRICFEIKLERVEPICLKCRRSALRSQAVRLVEYQQLELDLPSTIWKGPKSAIKSAIFAPASSVVWSFHHTEFLALKSPTRQVEEFQD